MKKNSNTPEMNSIWLANYKSQTNPPLNTNIRPEVCIIGAGISGLTCAYLLLKEDLDVVIIDKDAILRGDTSKTSAHLSNALDDRYYNLIRVFGKDKAKLAIDSHIHAIDLIEKICQEEKIDCDFNRVNGYLFSNKTNHTDILKEHEASKELKIPTKLTTLSDAIQSDERKCLEFENQAEFHPIKYLTQLSDIVKKNGAKIYENTQAKKIDLKKNIIELTNGNKITAKYIIQATNYPTQCSMSFHTKVECNRSYVIAFAIPKNVLAAGLYWDNEEPYHYIRIMQNEGIFKQVKDNEKILIVGGEDHRVGFKPKANPYVSLEKWVRKYIPKAGKVIAKWSGQIIEPVDYLSYIGKTIGAEKNNFMITGDSGNGLTHGTFGAILVTDLIKNRKNLCEELYDPARKTLSTTKDFLCNVTKISSAYVGYVTPGEINNVKGILPNEGCVLRKGIKKIAAYRDEEGKLYEFSAVCPHLSAILEWNTQEKTWDCPAHGSRFSAKGDLINGPAKADMKCIRKPKMVNKECD